MNRLEGVQPTGKQLLQPAGNASGNGRAPDKRSRMPRPGQRILNLQEAASYLGCCEWTVKELILDGMIPQVALTSRIQVDILDLEKLIEARKKLHTTRIDLLRRVIYDSAARSGAERRKGVGKVGYLFHPKVKRKDGTIYEDPIWWVKFYLHGRPVRRSTGTHKRACRSAS